MSNPRLSSNTVVAIAQLKTHAERLIEEMKQRDSSRMDEFAARYEFIKEELNKRSANERAAPILANFEANYQQQKSAIDEMINEQKKGAEMYAAFRKRERAPIPESFKIDPDDPKVQEQAKAEKAAQEEIRQPAMSDEARKKQKFILNEMMTTELTYLQSVQSAAYEFEKFRTAYNQKLRDVDFFVKHDTALRSNVEDFMNGFIDLSKSSTEMFRLLHDNKANKDFHLDIDALTHYLKNESYWDVIRDTTLNMDKFSNDIKAGKNAEYHQDLNSSYLDHKPDGQNTIQSITMAPVQRGPRWRLLLEDLIKNSDPNDADYQKKVDLLNFVKVKMESVNSLVRKQEMQPMVDAIGRELDTLYAAKKDPDAKQAISEVKNTIYRISEKKLENPEDYMIEIQKELNKIRVTSRSMNLRGESLFRNSSVMKAMGKIDKAIEKSDYYKSFTSRQTVAIKNAQASDLLQKKNEMKSNITKPAEKKSTPTLR